MLGVLPRVFYTEDTSFLIEIGDWMALRPVQLTESGSGDQTRVRHVIGIDESGNPVADSTPFVIAAVQCPRSVGERLAECLIESGLRPWRTKSQSLSGILDDPEEQNDRVEAFIESIEEEPISWSAAVGWENYSVPERAAVTAMMGSRTLTTPHLGGDLDFEGDAVLLADGGRDTFGENQQELRRQSASKFNSRFQAEFCSVYVSSLERSDYTYPESIAADYIAGYIRNQIDENEASVETLPSEVDRINTGWREPDIAPLPLYLLRTSGATYSELIKARVIAWIEGRRPPQNAEFSTGNQYENVVDRIDSPVVQEYLSELSE